MKKIEQINYVKVLLLLIFTILVTFLFSKIYMNKTIKYSLAYQEFNKIRINEMTEYLIENPTLIVYIGNKCDIEKENEYNFIKLVRENNLTQKIIYIDIEDKIKSFQNKLEKEYNAHVDLNSLPVLLLFVDGRIADTIYIDSVIDVDRIMELGDF